MKKNIPIKKVVDIAVAIVPTEEDKDFWEVYLINLKGESIRTVFVVSRGYGQKDGHKIETSKLRYFYENINAETAVKVELINKELFELTNEYWLSFQHDDFMYDKKYIFVSESLTEDNLTTIPIVNQKGIMIK